jgi:hypothetical protein
MDSRRLGLPLFTLLCVLSTSAFASTLALVGAKVYPSPTEAPIENATIVIRDGRILAVGPSAKVKPPRLARLVTVVNCRRMFITSGYWNSHVHFTEDVWKNAASADAAKLEEHKHRFSETLMLCESVSRRMKYPVREFSQWASRFIRRTAFLFM